MWLVILIIAIVIGAIWGAASDDGPGAAGGALMGGIGCGYILLRIFLAGLGILFIIWIFGLLFG